jgi:hypothetical protein
MATVQVSGFLRNALILDAVASAASGAAQVAGAGRLDAWLQLPRGLLLESGVFMLGYAVALALLARRATLPAPLVLAVIVGNLAWALACVALPLAGVLAPAALGYAWLAVQALAVLLFAELEFIGLRRSPAWSDPRRALRG